MIETEMVKSSFYTYYVIKGTDILHREEGPAVEWNDGRKDWYINGMRHRVDGPAAIYSDGTKEWYLNGMPHREDGPAATYYNGKVDWYLNGVSYSKEEWFEALTEEQKSKALYSEYFIRG
jgi:hypothetical protein